MVRAGGTMTRPCTIIFGVMLAFAACGPSNHGPASGGDGGTTGAHLEIAPAQATLTVTGGVAATQAFTITAVDDSGGTTDVTGQAALVIDQSALGTFAGADFTSATDHGGHGKVTATWNGETATADVTILLHSDIVLPGAPASAPTDFHNGTPGGPAPSMVYPDSGVVVPPNMGTMEFHFRPGAGQTVFQLTFTGSTIQTSIYFPCTTLADGCVFSPSKQVWDILATAGRGDAPLFYTLSGLDAQHTIGSAPARSIQFATDDITGGIYYWAASAGMIMRYDWGLPTQTAEQFLTTQQAGGLECVGCHTLTRDGSAIAVGTDIPGPAGLTALTVSTRTVEWTTNDTSMGIPFPSANGANFFSFSPDNKQLIASGGTNLTVRDATTGMGMTTVIQNGTMPDWAPDGQHVVFAQAGTQTIASNPGVASGSIVQVTAGAWSQTQTLVAASNDNNYYPSYSPNGDYVLFDKTADTSDSFDKMDARIWVVSSAGGAPIQLANASPAPGGDSWPKWSPVPHMYAKGPIYWLTFSSRRAYGMRGGGTAQIWMVGFDPARAAVGLDPTFAAFWLPFQDPASGNHIAQWVEKVDRQPCNSGPCPNGEFCGPDGVCIPNPE
jgi:hypothetical protein